MAYAGDNPNGYYVGRPVQQPTPAAVDEPVNAQVPGVPGYYAGRVQGKKTVDGGGNHVPSPKPEPEQGFLARCFPCLSGGGATQ
ncbi:hypothetical protein ACP4OV_015178 [Aristida adscensionis]